MSPLVPFVFFYQPGGLYVVDWLPGVIAFGVALPLNEILQLFFLSIMSVAPDGLDLVLFSVIDKVRWGSRIVLPVFFCLHIGGKKGGVENGVYGPLRREVQLVSHRGDDLFNLEGAVSSRG